MCQLRFFCTPVGIFSVAKTNQYQLLKHYEMSDLLILCHTACNVPDEAAVIELGEKEVSLKLKLLFFFSQTLISWT